MSEIATAVGRNRGPLFRWVGRFLAAMAILALVGSLFSQGLGGALTTVATVPQAGAELIVFGGVPILAVIMVARYWGYGLQMFHMGTRGKEEIRIFAKIRGGFIVDAVIYRWMWVGILALTSLGINLGISEADRTLGTGPRTAFMVCCTAMAGLSVLVAERLWNQLVARAVLLLGVALAVALTSNNGQVDPGGLMWAGIVGLHMFAVQKGLTALGTTAFADEDMNKMMSQRYRDIGMLLANAITFILMLGYAAYTDVWPTPDKFAASPLPLWILYPAVPGLIMVIPILGMNWARGRLTETWNAMISSTAPVWGAFAAAGLGLLGWPNTPTLDATQKVGIAIVVLAAVGAGIDVAVRERWSKRFDQMERELKQVYALLEAANTERETAYAERVQAGVLFREADAELREAQAKCERLQAELAALIAEAQPPAVNGAKSVSYSSVRGLSGTPDGGIRIGYAGGLTVESEGVVIEAKGVQEAFVDKDGRFKGDLVESGVVTSGGRVFEFQGGEVVKADPDGNYSIDSVHRGNSTGAQSAE